MSSCTKEATDRLKEVINGKSKTIDIEKKRQALKRKLENLRSSNKTKKGRLCQLKIDQSTIMAEGHIDRTNPQAISSSDSESQDYTVSVNTTEEAHISLPPKPPDSKVEKPTTSELSDTIAKLLQSSCKLNKPIFKFEVSESAAQFNIEKLREHDFNLDKLLNNQKSVTSYGSEFKPIAELQPLLGHHPRWNEMKKRLEEGACFPIKEIDEETRLQDLNAMKIRGNHKSAIKNEDYLSSAFEKEVKKGWILLLPDKDIDTIPDLELAPMGVADQLGVSATGEFVKKLRVTHDLSFPQAISGESINSRVKQEELEPCMFGHTFLRLIHHIVYLRQKYPNTIIWLRKEDFKSAYRRLHLNAKTALKSAVRVKLQGLYYILVSLRLPFGGSPCPSDFCLVSDVITDTINDLLASTTWNPDTVKSEYTKNIPNAKAQSVTVPFAVAKDLSVSLNCEPDSKADVFVDDIMSVTVDRKDNLKRLIAAPCTVIHAIAHKAEGITHISRQDLISDEKNEAEGAPEEIKICLGWKLDTRRLLVSLPHHKYQAWNSQIEAIIKTKTVKYKTLESILGRLENVAIIIGMMGHFLNNIRSIQIKASESQHNQKLTKNAVAELKLAQKFLVRAKNGISMNTITFRKPSRIYIGDASEHGLGGLCEQSGRAWRFVIPPKLRGRAHINLLEFLIQVVSIWLDIYEGNVKQQDCLLALGDNTTAAGWCRRTNFREKVEGDRDWIVKQQVARQLANLILDSETVLYTQWFKGTWNLVTDSLSRDMHIFSEESHTLFLQKTVHCQLPHNFQIRPLPEKISCFITSMLQQLPVQKQRSRPQKASDLAHLKLGKHFSTALNSQDPYISTDSILSKRISLYLPLLTPFDQAPSLHDITSIWWREQSSPPSHMWRRPSGQTTGQTRDWTLTARPASS